VQVLVAGPSAFSNFTPLPRVSLIHSSISDSQGKRWNTKNREYKNQEGKYPHKIKSKRRRWLAEHLLEWQLNFFLPLGRGAHARAGA
jgi:hypothetical protein